MTNKQEFQQELKEKIKEGVKLSDLKKKKLEGNSTQFIHGIPTPPPTPPLKPTQEDNLPPPIRISENKQIKELQGQVKYWSNTAANYLKSLQKLTAENDNLKEEIKKIKPTKTQTELEKALQEANQKIREKSLNNKKSEEQQKNNLLQENIKKLQTKINEQEKTIESLQNQAKNKDNNQEQPIKSFFCDGCQLTKSGEYIKRKIDSPFEP
ncbi:2836_t:CDS:1, partial [Racocetra persica]